MNEIFNSYIEAFDELNVLTTASYYSADNEEQIADDVLSFLIQAYRLGIAAAGEMLTADLSVDVDSMRDVIYFLIDGKTFEDRVATHVASDNLTGLKLLVESEYQRVFNAAIYDGGEQYQRNTGIRVSKVWRTMLDEDVRDTHRYLEGMTVPLDDYFYAWDGDYALAPHGFTQVWNNANCRCVLVLKMDGLQN